MSGFLLLRQSITNVLGTNFKFSSQFYFHCWNVLLYIVLAALNFTDHVCIYHAKYLSLWHCRPVLNLFTYLVEELFLLLMLLFLVYFYIWAECLFVHISVNDISFRVMFRSDNFLGPRVKFDYVLGHIAMMLRCGNRTIASSICLNISNCHAIVMTSRIITSSVTLKYFRNDACGVPGQSICEKFESILFRLYTFILIYFTLVNRNRDICLG